MRNHFTKIANSYNKSNIDLKSINEVNNRRCEDIIHGLRTSNRMLIKYENTSLDEGSKIMQKKER